ncbi:hypothetical protein [Variovorax saccharolyticus]|uniref:hypothetical protein n=1 Tax=Variovorax saccharolyticus TaxID=3053516 RepID=UPI00257829C9|nr:hypothetical protein [Variovorax sp. J22R187]MDM0018846.1 hypothetical protein [Variovorax sp. J22R187]
MPTTPSNAGAGHAISGTVTGLSGSGLVLQNNAGDDLAIAADGSFRFLKPVASGRPYAVTVKSQPNGPLQTCSVSFGSGLVNDVAISNVSVVCSSRSFSVRGAVVGLSGSGLVLQNNGGDDLAIATDGAFRFPASVASTAGYAVTVRTQPTGPSQTCSVINASGTVVQTEVSDVTVLCATNSHTIGGIVSGLRGNGLVLMNNAGDDLTITANGAFQFTTPVASGANYWVTVKTQPQFPNMFCTVRQSYGGVASAAVTTVEVNCVQSVPTRLSSIQLQSDPDDRIGRGMNYGYTHANSVIGIRSLGGLLQVFVRGDQSWSGDFFIRTSPEKLRTGTFSEGLDWGGEGRGCSRSPGLFTIRSVEYVDDVLTAIDLTFEQHCEGSSAALRGQIYWTAYDNSVAPGPINPPPAGLWQPVAGAVPTSGNYVYLTSDPGDYIGLGRTYLYSPDSSPMRVFANKGTLSVGLIDGAWHGSFAAMEWVAQLRPGYYGDLVGYPFHNPAKGGLFSSGDGRACSSVRGWFAVDDATYVGAELKSIDLRFEQHCGTATPALRGKIHWVF